MGVRTSSPWGGESVQLPFLPSRLPCAHVEREVPYSVTSGENTADLQVSWEQVRTAQRHQGTCPKSTVSK